MATEENNHTDSADDSKSNKSKIDPYAAKITAGVVVVLILIGAAFLAGNLASRRRSVVYNNRFGVGMMNKGAGLGARRGSMMSRGSRVGRGITGKVTAINGSNLTMTNSANNQSLTVSTTATTSVYTNGTIAKFSDIQTDNTIIVRGTPGSDGTIAATAINILP